MTLPQGIHHGVPMADYIADPCKEPSLSASTIGKLVQESPLKAWQWHPRLGGKPQSSTKAAEIGTAAHALALEGADIIQVVSKVSKADGTEIVPKNWQTNEAKAAREKILGEGRIPLLPHEAPAVYEMSKKAGEAIAQEAGGGKAEATIIWQEANGVWCKARADWLPNDESRPVVDYKTTKKSAEAGEFIRRTLYQMSYDISAAWYLRGLAAIGEPRLEYRFLVQEQDKPYDYSWVGLEATCEAITTLKPWVEKAIHVWGECLKSGEWPGYPKHVHYADPSTWRAIQIEDSILADQLEADTFGDS